MLPNDYPQPDVDNGKLAEPPWHPDQWPAVRGMAYWEWFVADGSVFYSREWQRLLQAGDERVLGPGNAQWWPWVHEDDLAPFLEASRIVVEGRTDQYEALFRIRRGDGAWLWILSRGCVTQKDRGKPVRVAGTVSDVTPLRSDIKFRHGSQVMGGENALPVDSPDLILRMNRQLEPLDIIPGLARRLGHGADGGESPAEDAPPGLLPEHLAFLRANASRVFESGLPARETVTFPTAYGHDVTGEYSFSPEYGPDGRVGSVLAQFRDVTERLRVERHARLNEMRLEALHHLAQMDDASREDVLAFVMESLIRLTGSEAGLLFLPADAGEEGRMVWSGELRRRIGRDRLPQTEMPADLLDMIARNKDAGMRRLLNGNGLFPLHTSLDGALPVMHFIAAPVFDRERLVCLAAVFNKESLYYEDDLQQLEAFIRNAWLILRRHTFVRQLQDAKEAAETANRVKDAFLANVSHELRTPLNGVLGMLQLLEETPLSSQQREYADMAGISGRALRRIVSDILDFSRMEAGKVELQCETMDLAETVRSATEIFRQDAARKGLELSVVVDGAIPARVYGDEGRVRQIVFNLVGNALKFTETGGVAVSCALLPFESPRGISVRFGVRDTGVGIPRDKRDSVFDAFVQLGHAAAKKHSGTGLGLPIVKRLAGLMNGSVAIDDGDGVGTTVRCDLRFAEAMAAPTPKTPNAPTQKVRAPALDVLVVEDDPISGFALTAFLQRSGHRPVCVGDGAQALEALQLHSFHCVFTDILMPDMDGLELVKRIRGQDYADHPPTEETGAVLRAVIRDAGREQRLIDPGIVTVSVSAHAMAGDHEKFLSQGMDYCISKPVLLQELRDVLALIAQRVFGRPGCAGE